MTRTPTSGPDLSAACLDCPEIDSAPENPWRTNAELIAAQVLAAAGVAGLFGTILLGFSPWLGFACVGGLSLLLNLSNSNSTVGGCELLSKLGRLAVPSLTLGLLSGGTAWFLTSEEPGTSAFLGFFLVLGPTLLIQTRRALRQMIV